MEHSALVHSAAMLQHCAAVYMGVYMGELFMKQPCQMGLGNFPLHQCLRQ